MVDLHSYWTYSFSSMIYILNIVIFPSHVSLPEGSWSWYQKNMGKWQFQFQPADFSKHHRCLDAERSQFPLVAWFSHRNSYSLVNGGPSPILMCNRSWSISIYINSRRNWATWCHLMRLCKSWIPLLNVVCWYVPVVPSSICGWEIIIKQARAML